MGWTIRKREKGISGKRKKAARVWNQIQLARSDKEKAYRKAVAA